MSFPTQLVAKMARNNMDHRKHHNKAHWSDYKDLKLVYKVTSP